MRWEQRYDKALGYTAYLLVARHSPGDPHPIYYPRETEYITAGDMNFMSQFANKTVGSHPWGAQPYRILPQEAFNALRERGLPGLVAYRLEHGAE